MPHQLEQFLWYIFASPSFLLVTYEYISFFCALLSLLFHVGNVVYSFPGWDVCVCFKSCHVVFLAVFSAHLPIAISTLACNCPFLNVITMNVSTVRNQPIVTRLPDSASLGSLRFEYFVYSAAV